MTKEELYKLAYENHYYNKKIELANELYNTVINEYPKSNEAKYALDQLVNLEKEKFKPIKYLFDAIRTRTDRINYL